MEKWKALGLVKLIRRGSLSKPYLIMEAGVNHEGDIKKAKTMIEQAASQELMQLNSRRTKRLLWLQNFPHRIGIQQKNPPQASIRSSRSMILFGKKSMRN